jgi:hypothetical protein
VGRPAHYSRARGLIGVGDATVRAPLLCISPFHPQKKALYDQDSVVGSDSFDGMNDEGDSDYLDY